MTWLVSSVPVRGSNSRPARTTVAGGGAYAGAEGGTHAGGRAVTAGCCAASLSESDAARMATENTRDAVTVCLLTGIRQMFVSSSGLLEGGVFLGRLACALDIHGRNQRAVEFSVEPDCVHHDALGSNPVLVLAHCDVSG